MASRVGPDMGDLYSTGGRFCVVNHAKENGSKGTRQSSVGGVCISLPCWSPPDRPHSQMTGLGVAKAVSDSSIGSKPQADFTCVGQQPVQA